VVVASGLPFSGRHDPVVKKIRVIVLRLVGERVIGERVNGVALMSALPAVST